MTLLIHRCCLCTTFSHTESGLHSGSALDCTDKAVQQLWHVMWLSEKWLTSWQSVFDNRTKTAHNPALCHGRCNCSFKRLDSERERELKPTDQSGLVTYERPLMCLLVSISVCLSFAVRVWMSLWSLDQNHMFRKKCICSSVTACLKTALQRRTYSTKPHFITIHLNNLCFGTSSLGFKEWIMGLYALCTSRKSSEGNMYVKRLQAWFNGPINHTHKYTIHIHVLYTHRWKPSTVLVDISTKKCLQMNGIDLFSLFSGPEQHRRLFE